MCLTKFHAATSKVSKDSLITFSLNKREPINLKNDLSCGTILTFSRKSKHSIRHFRSEKESGWS